MKLLFIHTAEKVKIDSKNNYYTDGAYDEKVWTRYLKISNDITFLARQDKNQYDDEIIEKKFNIIKSKNIKVETIDNTYTSIKTYLNPKIRSKINEKIKRLVQEADRVIIRLPCDEGYTAVKYAKKMGKEYLIECVGCVWDSLWNYNYKGKILAPFKFIKMRNAIKDTKYVLYVTQKFLQKRYPTKGKSISCSNVVLDNLDEKVLKARKDKLILKKEKIIIGTLAAVDVTYKGQNDVITAISTLIQKGYDIEYQLVGNGNQTVLKKLSRDLKIEENVKFLGAYPHSKVFEWLDSIDIYIQPSKQEGLPRALIEAMSRGNICLGTNVAGIPELLDNNFIFKKGDIKQLRNKIEYIVNNQDEVKQQAEVNFNKSKEYINEILDARRTEFFNEFAKEK